MGSPPFGLGFRPRYFGEIVAGRPAVDWFEIVSENFMGIGGRTREMLVRLRAAYPVVLHGVSLSIAGTDPLDEDHLGKLRALADEIEPLHVTDHLCWTSWRGRESHDLLPVAYTGEVLDHVSARVAHVQERLGRRLSLENPSAYVAFAASEMGEAEFFEELCRRTGCGILLDVNNLYVNAMNLGVDAERYLETISPEHVAYFHLAGHTVLPDVRVDTHDDEVCDPVWELYRRACLRFPDAGNVIERDDRLPELGELLAEVEHARRVHAESRGMAALPHVYRASAPKDRRPAARSAPGWAGLQERFWVAVGPESVDPDDDVAGATGLLPTGSVRPERGLRVYRDGYVARLCRGLSENFPALAHVIGRAEFDALATAYVRRHPPVGWEFRSVGAKLAGFILEHRFGRDFGVPVEVLADLAAFEQAEIEVHDEPDPVSVVEPEALARIAPAEWEDARVQFIPALRRVECRYDVLPVVEAVAAGRDPERPNAAESSYLVCRPGTEVVRRRLSEEHAVVIRLLVDGASFGQACRELASRWPDLDEKANADLVAQALVKVTGLGLVERVATPGNAGALSVPAIPEPYLSVSASPPRRSSPRPRPRRRSPSRS